VREDEAVQAEVARVRELLGNDGRILLRESGTEPVVRIMVEASTEELCEKYTQSVADVICARGLA
jgi:phosphoglucosamine mutase